MATGEKNDSEAAVLAQKEKERRGEEKRKEKEESLSVFAAVN